MGQKLLEIYRIVGDQCGMSGKMKLAQMTKMPSTRAALEPDSSELVKKFEEAAEEIIGKPVSV